MSGIYIISLSRHVITVIFIFDFDEEEKRRWSWLLPKNCKCVKASLKKSVETIYFGGGTKCLNSEEINFLIESVYSHYSVIEIPKSRSKPIRFV
jgi:coproporphyrinogen III oxidase-like Fe-S oxidoreductase